MNDVRGRCVFENNGNALWVCAGGTVNSNWRGEVSAGERSIVWAVGNKCCYDQNAEGSTQQALLDRNIVDSSQQALLRPECRRQYTASVFTTEKL